ncbi:hypothetical protein [Deinococcus aerophilus]|uniref:Uncharacterized protein n=1 Tax=Deinococcus aerophilus TaxID=522488 RepID=A0ABQ2H079_9DEIO|nr:hypothetical protein [Deinococcus aerophilus]GGM22275.1 hypothetical protein GCM10010841_32680 [Deinococcus aerophilus]
MSDPVHTEQTTPPPDVLGGLEAEVQRGDAIVLVWNIQDVQTRADLTDEQARAVLAHVEREHDPEVGLNWSRIDDAIRAHGFELF